MTTLSRTFARASRRGKKLMEQYQPAGAYEAAEKWYRLAQPPRDSEGEKR